MAKDPLVQQYVMLWKAAALLPECEMEKELKKAIQLTQKNYAQNRLTKRMSWTEINIVQHICHCHYRNNPNKGIAETRELLSMLTNYNFPEEQCRFYIPVLMNNLSYYYYTNNTFSELDKMKEHAFKWLLSLIRTRTGLRLVTLNGTNRYYATDDAIYSAYGVNVTLEEIQGVTACDFEPGK